MDALIDLDIKSEPVAQPNIQFQETPQPTPQPTPQEDLAQVFMNQQPQQVVPVEQIVPKQQPQQQEQPQQNAAEGEDFFSSLANR